MNIYIDESGLFVPHSEIDSWSVVVAVCAPESSRRSISGLITRLRRTQGISQGEVKLPKLEEKHYQHFLDELAQIDLAVFATATDSGLNTPDLVQAHKAKQLESIRKNIERMKFEGGRLGVVLLADQIESLPNQLYVQLLCQINLLYDVINRGINFYAQRKPAALREFRWRIDQKNTTKTVFEEAFEKIAPPLLQARSLHEPMLRVHGFNYRYFENYEFAEGETPDYLQTEYGLPPVDGFNLQKLVRENLKFVDSNESDGVQIADLLASGLRRSLKRAFDDPVAIAKKIGRLTVQNSRGKQSINLISLSDEQVLQEKTSSIVRHLDNMSRPYIYRRK